MKIIFLDMDGVMNSVQSSTFYYDFMGEKSNWFKIYLPEENDDFGIYHSEICPMALSNMRYLLKQYPDIKIVISSTWRRGRSVEYFNKLFKYLKMIDKDLVIDKTPIMSGHDRGEEIDDWLERNKKLNIENFVILDDDSDMAMFLGTDHFVQTDNKIGFDYIAMQKVDKFFGGFNLKIKDLKSNIPYKIFEMIRDQIYYFDASTKQVYYKDKDGEKREIYYPEGRLYSEVK